jgi:hypothetical protein
MLTFDEWLQVTEYYPANLAAFKSWLGDRLNQKRSKSDWDQLYFDWIDWLAQVAGNEA